MPARDQVARELAAAHYRIEPGIIRIFQLREDSEKEKLASTPIKLLEVNEFTSPSGVMPLYFGPSPASGIPYPSVILEVTPDEFEQIRSSVLHLPAGWSIAQELPREAG